MRRFSLVLAATTLVFASAVTTAGPASAAVTSIVNSTADTAYALNVDDCLRFHTCTLRAAITRANANGGGTIRFGISGSGVHTIAVGSTGLGALPVISQPVTIDGTTQPGYVATPLIELNGASAGSGVLGLDINAGPSVVKGLTINRFNGYGIGLYVGSDVVVANFIGTDSTGTAPAGNSGDGIYVNSANNQIGGTTAAERNVISANGEWGVEIDRAPNNVIEGNRIGTDASGTAALGNGLSGVRLNDSSNVVGGTVAGAANVISGNGTYGVDINHGYTSVVEGNRIGTDASGTAALGNVGPGVFIWDSSSGNVVGGTVAGAANVISGNGIYGVGINGAGSNVIEGNRIGTDASGTTALGNSGDGVGLEFAASNTVGGTVAGAANVISANGSSGVHVYGGSSNVIEGNDIGTDASGTVPLGNGGDGVTIQQDSSGNVVGGTVAGAANVISANRYNGVGIPGGSLNVIEGNHIGTDASGSVGLGNGGDGVAVLPPSATGNTVSKNSIFSNALLGIDLGADSVTPNDPGDGDTGPNQLQNFPVLTSADSVGGQTTVLGTLDSTPSTAFTLEFFSSPSCDPSGYGEGQTLLGSTGVLTDGGGHASFSPAFPAAVPAGQVITATATDPSGNTSEFSACVTVFGQADLSITDADSPDPVTDAGSLTYTLTVTNNGPDSAHHVAVTDTLDPTQKLVSATPGQGSCSGSTPVTCDLGVMTSGQIVTIAVVVHPLSPGTVANAASVAESEPDPVPGNNVAAAATTVTGDPNAVLVTGSGFSPKTLKLKTQGSMVQWNFLGPGQHSATDPSGMGLFDSGLRSAIDDYQFVFVSAGTYTVSDSGSANTGAIKVPVIVKPKSGGTGTTFTVTWAASAPVGYDFDVQIKRPGSTAFVDWRPDTVATSATFVPDAGIGTYKFRARIEKGASGPASGYSAAKKITVS